MFAFNSGFKLRKNTEILPLIYNLNIHQSLSNKVKVTFFRQTYQYQTCSSSYQWSETMSLNCGHQRAYSSSPR
jgi:hypothetical protein